MLPAFAPLRESLAVQIKRNLGTVDRVLRGGISLLMLYFGFFSDYFVTDIVTRVLLGGMGIALMTVAIVAYCPGYALIGFSTAPCEVDGPH
jgi:hypothetical protein